MTARTETRQWCDRHWAPVRLGMAGLGPQVNGLLLTTMVMQEILGEVQRRGGEPHDPARCNAIIAELLPICCFLGDVRMQELVFRATTSRGLAQ